MNWFQSYVDFKISICLRSYVHFKNFNNQSNHANRKCQLFGKKRSETTQVLSSILSVTRILGRQRNLYGFKLAAEELPTSELSSVIEILSQLTIAEKLIIFYALADVAPEQNSNIHKFSHISSPLQMIQWMSHRSPMIRMSQWQLPPIIPTRGNWRCNLEEPWHCNVRKVS